MSFRAAINIEQNVLGEIEITDISDYSVETHAAFISRDLFLYKNDGTLLTVSPAFTFSNYPEDKIIIALKKDYCLKIVMVLTPTVAILGSKYSITEIFKFDYYSKEYMVQMGLTLSRKPLSRSDGNFYSTMQQYYVNTKLAALSADNLQQAASQFWLDRMGGASSIIQLANESVAISQPEDTVVSVYSFKATGSEGNTLVIPSLKNRKILFVFRDDPKPLWEVLPPSNPIIGEFSVVPETGTFKFGIEMQSGEPIQIQHTSQ